MKAGRERHLLVKKNAPLPTRILSANFLILAMTLHTILTRCAQGRASAFTTSHVATWSRRSACRIIGTQSANAVKPTNVLPYGAGTIINSGGRGQNIAFFATSAGDDGDAVKKTKDTNKNKKPKRKKKVTPKFQVDAESLRAAFDALAKKDGFDGTMAHFADAKTFEDPFKEEDSLADDDNEDDVNMDFDLSDFDDDDYDDDEFIDFGDDNGEQSMEERIASAQRDLDMGRISVDEELDSYARDVTEEDMRKLGYRREKNPFGDDETPRKEAFKLITNAMTCSACGSDFQCSNATRPGYLPSEKYETQVKLSKIEEMQRLQEKSESFEWSPEDEIEWLIQSEGSGVSRDGPDDFEKAAGINIDAMAEELELDLVALSQKKTICKRCHGLQNFGEVEESLRPGWTEEPLMSQARFRDLLRPIREKTAVIIALVDLFDFSGSVLPELDSIAGDNPVILAANKADLLPSKMGQARAENWVRRELEYLGVQSIANVGGAVRLVSCKTGYGLSSMLQKAQDLAEDMDCDVYVVGAANAGKSTLINFILDKNVQKTGAGRNTKKRAGNQNAKKGAVTTSPLPGTTLKFIQVDLGNGQKLYDTPGLLVPGTLTQLLTPAELKMVVPKKEVEPITLRIASGKCVQVGGLARIEVIGDSKPFLFTFFVSNDIKLHPTDTSRADELIAKHVGGLITPPLAPGPERMEQIGEFESHDIEIDGTGWKEAAADITLRGLGWVAVTGAGVAKVRVSVPKGIGISVRPPLMPFDIWEAAASHTGGKAVRKGGKTKSGKRRKGVGRR